MEIHTSLYAFWWHSNATFNNNKDNTEKRILHTRALEVNKELEPDLVVSRNLEIMGASHSALATPSHLDEPSGASGLLEGGSLSGSSHSGPTSLRSTPLLVNSQANTTSARSVVVSNNNNKRTMAGPHQTGPTVRFAGSSSSSSSSSSSGHVVITGNSSNQGSEQSQAKQQNGCAHNQAGIKVATAANGQQAVVWSSSSSSHSSRQQQANIKLSDNKLQTQTKQTSSGGGGGCGSSKGKGNKVSPAAGGGAYLTPTKLADDSIMEQERRESIQYGDVFIYPTLYKDLNECQRCSRDNKICSCNSIETATETCKNSSEQEQNIKSAQVMDKSNNNNNNTNIIKSLEKVNRDLQVKQDNHHDASRAATCSKVQGQVGIIDQDQVGFGGEMKTVYKINISTASIDQKNNQLILSSPKLIKSSLGTGSATVAKCPPPVPQRHTTSDLPVDGLAAIEQTNLEGKGMNRGDMSYGEQVNGDEWGPLNKITTSSTSEGYSPAGGAIDSEKTQALDMNNGAEEVENGQRETTTTSGKLLPLSTPNQENFQVNGYQYQNLQSQEATKVTTISIGSPNSSTETLNLISIPALAPQSSSEMEFHQPNMVDLNNNNSSDSGNQVVTDPIVSKSSPCDIRETRDQSLLMNQLIEQERTNEEQLTCKLSVGDSIKVTSTSIWIGGNKSAHSNSNNLDQNHVVERHTSIVPIVQSLSNRRRNMASKLSRQAIHEDSAVMTNSNDESTLNTMDQFNSLTKGLEECELVGEGGGPAAGSSSQQDNSSDTLEYSPILTSVRDYIKNVNTELQVQSPSLLGGECEFPIVGPLSRGNPLESSVETTMLVNGAPIITMAGGGNIVAPTTIVTSTTGALTITSSSSSSVVSTASGIVTTSAGFTGTGNHNLLSLDHSGDSPKKSIFEGASKDEILEYLEDARERVPEILMAADDVMVINENELLVVNQLDPESPATPISIVEATEVIGAAELCPVDDSGQLIATVTTLPTTESSTIERHSPDEFRHRLQQIYHNSQLVSVNSQYSSGCNTMDDDTGISSGEQQDEGSKVNSIRNSMDTPITPTEIVNITAPVDCPDGSANLKGFSMLDSALLSGSSSVGAAKYPLTLSTTDNCAIFTIDRDQLNANSEQVGQKLENQSSVPVTCVNSHQTIQKQQQQVTIEPSKDTPSQGLRGGGFPIRELSFSVAARRRNSTSSEGSNKANYRTIQMLRLRHSNRDSLSSPSTSPPSSASPSSSTSSNQTSGNCSTASTFYASSSLSCSSPLLALSSVATSYNPIQTVGASSGRATHLTTQPQASISRYPEFDCQTTTNNITAPASQLNNSISPDGAQVDLNLLSLVERDDSGLGSDSDRNKLSSSSSSYYESNHTKVSNLSASPKSTTINTSQDLSRSERMASISNSTRSLGSILNTQEDMGDGAKAELGGSSHQVLEHPTSMDQANKMAAPSISTTTSNQLTKTSYSSSIVRFSSKKQGPQVTATSSSPTFSSSANLMSRSVHGHYATMNRLNNYFMNRHPLSENSDTTIEFQCLDCDQFIDVDHATMLHKSNELRLLRDTDRLDVKVSTSSSGGGGGAAKEKPLTADQLDRAYIAAMNGLPLCNSCEKKRVERKEIISEFIETELKYGRDLKIIHDEFYRPMQIAGLLSKDQITGVFLNLEELIMAHCKFAIRLEASLRDAQSMGDTDYNTINIGRLFVESSEMLHAFEAYCIRQGAAACLLARLAKEKELLRIFLRVSQMENTLLRRMNLAAFLMVPVQRVTKYPLLLNRLYKVTAYHHKDREVLRDAQLKVELHLEHINQQTKGAGASNKIWRRISNLSAPISNRRGLINAEDIGYIKLRKTAMDLLKWDRDEIQFIHSGKLNFTPLNEFLIKQKMKPMRYMAAHALLIVLGKPNWKYRPDLVKSNLDNKLMTPTPGGNGVKEAALLLFREKGGRFIPCREPLFLSNCVLSADCSQYNSECPVIPTNHHNQKVSNTTNTTTTATAQAQQSANNCTTNSNSINIGTGNNSNNSRTRLASVCGSENRESKDRSASTESSVPLLDVLKLHREKPEIRDLRANSSHSDTLSMASFKSLPENHAANSSPPTHTSRSYSLASALPRTTVSATSSNLTKSSSITSSNLTIINQLMTKVNSYGHKQQPANVNGLPSKVVVTAADQINHQSTTTTTTAPNTTHHDGSFGGSNSNQQKSGIDPVITSNNNRMMTTNQSNAQNEIIQPQHYNHLFFNNHHHHQPYGDYEESFEIHERLTKESMLLRADTPLKTRYWLQMLRYHAKDLGQWRVRRHGLANIMMMRQE